MIKRRYYRDTHGDKDAPSGSSSSSSGSEAEAESSDDTDIEEEEVEDIEDEIVASDVIEKAEASSSSGYESEDSSVNEVNLDSSGLPTSDEDAAAQIANQDLIGSVSGGEGISSPKKDVVDFKTADCVLKRKSVFKCRICPRIVCFSEETLKAHLTSKKHARSEKLLREGRLKLMLNEHGKVEGEVFSNSDSDSDSDHDLPAKKSAKPNKKGKGPRNKRKRPTQETESVKAKPSADNRKKRREKLNKKIN